MSKGAKFPRKLVLPVARRVIAALQPRVDMAKVCGSLRRGEPRVGDIDVVVTGGDPHAVMLELGYREVPAESLEIVRHEYVPSDDLPIKVDIWTVPAERFGAGTMYATGTGVLNVVQRRWALYKGMELSVHGVHDSTGKIIASATEEDCYRALGWNWIPPVERNTFPPFVMRMLTEMNEAERGV